MHPQTLERLLLGIEITLFGIVLAIGGAASLGQLVGAGGLLIALSGVVSTPPPQPPGA